MKWSPFSKIPIISANGRKDSYLCKYDTEGDYIWGRLWGSDNTTTRAGSVDFVAILTGTVPGTGVSDRGV